MRPCARRGIGIGCAWPLLAVVADLAWAPQARNVQEWKVANTRTMHSGTWRVAEVELYADKACTRPIKAEAMADTSFTSHPHTEKVVTSQPVPAQSSGKDCVDPCGGKPGYCAWCGLGNACCRKGFQADPAECKQAQTFSTSHHECVMLQGEVAKVVSGGEKALDRSAETAFEAPCSGSQGCPTGSLVLGGLLPPEAPVVRCIVVLQARADAAAGGALHATLAQRPASGLRCPGACRSGRYLEGGKDGVCQEYLSQHGWCGSSPEHSSTGLDCRECQSLKPAGQHLEFRVVDREPRADGMQIATRLRDVASGLWRPTPAPLQHVGEDCWGNNCISGYCAWCGEGNACCKQGNLEDLPECMDASGWVALSHHECVALVHSGAVIDGPLPGWLLACAVLVPWLVGCAGIAMLLCRRKACSCCCRGSGEGADPGPSKAKSLSGDVFVPRGGRYNDREEEARKKALREEAKKLEWLT